MADNYIQRAAQGRLLGFDLSKGKPVPKTNTPSEAVGLPSDVSSIGDEAPGETLSVDPMRAVGILKGMGKTAGNILVEALKGETQNYDGIPNVPNTIANSARAVKKEQTKRREGLDFGQRWDKDLAERASGVPKLIGAVVEPLPKSIDQEAYGEDFGSALVEGAAGGLLQTGRHPLDTMAANPVSGFLDVVPIGKLLKATQPAQRASKAVSNVLREAGREAQAIPGLRQVVNAADDASLSIKRALVDSRIQPSAYASGVVEEAVRVGQTLPSNKVQVGRRFVRTLQGKWIAQGGSGVQDMSFGTTQGFQLNKQSATKVARELLPDADAADVVDLADDLHRQYRSPRDLPDIEGIPLEDVENAFLKHGIEPENQRGNARAYLGQHAEDLYGSMDEAQVAQKVVDDYRTTGELPIALPSRLNYDVFRENLANHLDIKDSKLKNWMDDFVVNERSSAGSVGRSFSAEDPHLSRTAHATLDWDDRVAKHRQSPGLALLESHVKSNLTARNPSSALNNFMGNLSLAADRSSMPAPVILGRLIMTQKDLGLLSGGYVEKLLALDPNDVAKRTALDNKYRDLRAIERTGLFDSSDFAAEGSRSDRAGAGAIESAYQKAAKWTGINLLEGVYQKGDVIFKVEEAQRSMNRYRDLANKLKPGEWIDLELEPNVMGRVRNVDGKLLGATHAGGKIIEGLTDNALQDLFARAGARQARNLYMDFGEAPALTKWMKSTPVLGFFSMFPTWAHKATDIPGIKKGLFYRSAEMPSDIVATNSSAVLKDQALRVAGTIASRTAKREALRNALKDETNTDLQQAVAFSASEPKAAIIRLLGDTDAVGVQTFGNWTYLGIAQSVSRQINRMRAGMMPADAEMLQQSRMIQTLGMSREDLESMPEDEVKDWLQARKAIDAMSPDEQRTLKQRVRLWSDAQQGKLGGAADAIKLIGISAGPVAQMIQKITAEGEEGKVYPLSAIVYDAVGNILLPTIWKNTLDVAAGAAAVEGEGATQDFGRRLTSLNPPKEQSVDAELVGFNDRERLIRWAIKKFTGIGYRALPAETLVDRVQTNHFLNGATKEWLRHLGADAGSIKELKDWAALKERQGNAKEAARLEKLAAQAEATAELVEDEMANAADAYREALELTKVHQKKGILGKTPKPVTSVDRRN